MKCIRVLHFSNIALCIWPPGGINMSKNWRKKIVISSLLFIIYMHSELQNCGKLWNLSGYNISVIDFCIWPPGGNSLKIVTICNIIVPVHNLHTEWIANLWQIMKSIRYNISVILISVFGHQGRGSDMSKNWKKFHIIVPVDNLGLHTQWIAIL